MRVDTLTLLESISQEVMECYAKQVDKKTPWIQRLTFNSHKKPCLEWLAAQHVYPKFYWVDRGKQDQCGYIGKIWSSTDTQTIKSMILMLTGLHADVKIYGGLPFHPNGTNPPPQWVPLNGPLFVLPAIEFTQHKSGMQWVVNCAVLPGMDAQESRDQLLNQVSQLCMEPSQPKTKNHVYVSRKNSPEREEWTQTIDDLLCAIEKGDLQKVVMARKSHFTFTEKVCPFQMIKELSNNADKLYQFCIQISDNWAFIGGTPERLFYRDHDHLYTEAIAGTSKRGKTTAEDTACEQHLLSSDKDILEHQFVLESIKGKLLTVCKEVRHDQHPSVLKLRYIQHLIYCFEGVLKEGVEDTQLLEILHPTPAVAGVPHDKAVQAICTYEKEGRGWYSGPIGWISRDHAEFVVAIRSGVVTGHTVSLYSGAGIVKGSQPDKEWEEIEDKIGLFIKLFSQ